jgi:hypothetical protein
MDEQKIKDLFLDPDIQDLLKQYIQEQADAYIIHSGVLNNLQQELRPIYDQTLNEVVYSGKTNCMIILGGDRNAGPGSGYGGKGKTGAASIDIVVGHLGPRPVRTINNSPVRASKNFNLDSARIYISQKADIDKYFGIPQYQVNIGNNVCALENSKGKSAVANKADCVRLIGRENIKLVTQHLGLASTNDDVALGGIDLIAGYDVPDLRHAPQPMVKGDNLLEAMKAVIKMVEELQSTLSNFVDEQVKINSTMLRHVHQVDTGAAITGEVVDNDIQTRINKIYQEIIPAIIRNFQKFKLMNDNYLDATSDKYINSFFNRVN